MRRPPHRHPPRPRRRRRRDAPRRSTRRAGREPPRLQRAAPAAAPPAGRLRASARRRATGRGAPPARRRARPRTDSAARATRRLAAPAPPAAPLGAAPPRRLPLAAPPLPTRPPATALAAAVATLRRAGSRFGGRELRDGRAAGVEEAGYRGVAGVALQGDDARRGEWAWAGRFGRGFDGCRSDDDRHLLDFGLAALRHLLRQFLGQLVEREAVLGGLGFRFRALPLPPPPGGRGGRPPGCPSRTPRRAF